MTHYEHYVTYNFFSVLGVERALGVVNQMRG